ncbi:MAG: FkbM family methyltransferase [Usitatibacter sp.]
MKSFLRSSVNAIPLGVRSRIRFVPGLARLQRWIVTRFLSNDPFLHTINAGPASGLRFEVTLPGDKAIWAGTYEMEFAQAIAGGVKRGGVCYDIGGYRGFMSGTMALAGASKVVVFEPLPGNQRALQRLCELNPALDIELKRMAVGNQDGTIPLRVSPDASMGKLATSGFQADAPIVDEIDVAVARLDSLVRGKAIPPPDLIKIDVEGAELDVLRGAGEVLASSKPLVFLEAHSASLEEECARELERLGYDVRRLEPGPRIAEETSHLIATPR